MSLLGIFTQQPRENLDYDIDYAPWLPTNDGIDTQLVEHTADPPGELVLVVAPNSTFIKVWVSGGQPNVTYKITVTITTDDGRIKQVEFKIKVKDT